MNQSLIMTVINVQSIPTPKLFLNQVAPVDVVFTQDDGVIFTQDDGAEFTQG